MQARLSDFKSTDLLTFLVALIELQIFAVQAKRTSARAAAEAYLQEDVHLDHGICSLVYRTPSKCPDNQEMDDLMEILYLGAPLNAKAQRTVFPVPNPYSSGNNGDIFAQSADQMWGNNAYADNRRQLITEMIDQLQTELIARGYAL